MKFLADEGVDKPIVTSLRNAGFDVDYILESNQGADDNLILHIANSQERILIAQDKDFGELVFRLKQSHTGIILIRIEGFTPSFKAQLVKDVLLIHQNELKNAFTVIQPNVIRIRK